MAAIGYAAGNLIGPQTFRSNEAPKYTSGVVTMLVCYCVSILLMFLYLAVATWENKQKDKKYGKPEEVHTGTAEDFVDVTDKQQHDFRYTS